MQWKLFAEKGLRTNKFKYCINETDFKDDNEISLLLGETVVGFTMYEILSKDYAISHFAKVDKKHHRAISDLLNWEEAKILHAAKIKYFNWEQDLGIPGLRYSKIKYKPAFVFKKFIVNDKS